MDRVLVRFEAADAAATKAAAARLAPLLQGGDLIILSGGLGAGKTTFTQGLGAALAVQGTVSSPTFVIVREHPIVAGNHLRPRALVHVDAYRLGGAVELDALDLDTALADSVTVIEWGSGVAESLSADRLEISIERPRGNFSADDDPESGVRVITCRGVGLRWADVDLAGLGARPADSVG